MNHDIAPLRDILGLMRNGQWHRAHDLVQRDPSLSAAWLHALLHVEEGDLEDAEYWYGKAGRNFRQRGSLVDELAAFESSLGAPDPA